MSRSCPTCGATFIAKRKDKVYCSRLCYRRVPEIAKRYSLTTRAYQKAHAKEPKRKYQKLIYKCKHEHRELGLSYEECIDLWNKGCQYCGSTLDKETGCGLDRLDNNGGYTINNVVPCCGPCNKIKNQYLTHEEMKIAMSAVLEYRKIHEAND